MKLRSALLLACLVVVPALAMFSHMIPPETRAYLRRAVVVPLADTAAASFGVAPPPSRAADTGTHAAEAAAFGTRTATLPPGAGSEPDPPVVAAPSAPISDPVPAVTPMFLGATDPTATAPTASVDSASRRTDAPAPADRVALESRLRALGATRVEWTPGQGGDGVHRCSCSVPAEPSGQLHRMFQASASDPVTALDTLVGQVTAWTLRSRVSPKGPHPSEPPNPVSTP